MEGDKKKCGGEEKKKDGEEKKMRPPRGESSIAEQRTATGARAIIMIQPLSAGKQKRRRRVLPLSCAVRSSLSTKHNRVNKYYYSSESLFSVFDGLLFRFSCSFSEPARHTHTYTHTHTHTHATLSVALLHGQWGGAFLLRVDYRACTQRTLHNPLCTSRILCRGHSK